VYAIGQATREQDNLETSKKEGKRRAYVVRYVCRCIVVGELREE
jgi:hypothetical protein